MAPRKPSFNHLTAKFADEDFEFVADAISLFDIDHAILIGGGAGPLFLKSSVNLAGSSSKSQVGRIVAVRLREELSNNSFPCLHGGEIGRVQVAQAYACGLEPETDVNPILLKP